MSDIALSLLGFELTLPVIILGVILGMTYGILAVGLVLVFRSNKIINFAHGEIGAFGAAVFGLVVTRWGVPYWLAFLPALAVSAGVSGLSEVMVVRRLRNAPRLMSIVATLGVGQFLLLFSLSINNQSRFGGIYPQPSWLPSFQLGPLRVQQAHVAMLVLTPLLVLGLILFLRRSKFGLAIQGSAVNPDAARLAGIYASRMSTMAWAIAGSVSAFTAILFSPTRGIITSDSFGPGLLLRALVAAVVARMTSLPIALAAGVGVGVIEQLLLWNYPQGGLVEAVLFVVILVALLTQRRITSGREEEKGAWAAVDAFPPLPERLLEVWSVRNLGRLIAGVSLLVAVIAPLAMSNASAVTLTAIVAFSIVGLSVGVVTGLGGQLTLGQFGIAGVGATLSYIVSVNLGNFVLSLALGALVSAAVSVAVGLPALRLKGLMLAVTTLSFALVTQSWLLQQSWMLGSGLDPGRPILPGNRPLLTGRSYYYFALPVLVFAYWLAWNIRRGGLGRRLVAIRDNEDAARAFTIPATSVKLQGFALAGILAGLGGAVYGHSFSRIGAGTFAVASSVDVVAMAVVGGIGVLAGPLLGAFYIVGVPKFLPLDSAGLAATAAGWLVLILYSPGGVAQLLRPLRSRAVDALARRAGLDPAEVRAAEETMDQSGPDRQSLVLRRPSGQASRIAVPEGQVILRVEDLRKHFGGVKAVDGVSFDIRRGEIVGLIGPNGAGKTTLFELLAGFTTADAGRVVWAGDDIGSLSPEARARRGIIRSFQDAALFPTLTVLETLRLAQERAHPTRIGPSLLGLRAAERAKDELARELVSAMGLDRYRNKQIRELSTGTRRITELACLVALEPEVLLLDEPASGIAQKETEALSELLVTMRRELDLTLLVIEHDIPLIMSISDRMVAMDAGELVVAGDPVTVRNHPRVVESYLGGDMTAVYRSGVMPTARPSHDIELGALVRQLPGVGPARGARIIEHFESADQLIGCEEADLRAVPGIGAAVATRIRAALDELAPTAPVSR